MYHQGGGELDLLRLSMYILVKLLMQAHKIAISSELQSDKEQYYIGGPGTPNDHEQMETIFSARSW